MTIFKIDETENFIIFLYYGRPTNRQKKLHPLENIIFISISAILCGAETWEEIEDFGRMKSAWFCRILNMENGVPSHDTFNRFFQLLNPKEFEKHFIKWVQSIIGKVDYEFVNIDGKTIRQASKMKENDFSAAPQIQFLKNKILYL